MIFRTLANLRRVVLPFASARGIASLRRPTPLEAAEARVMLVAGKLRCLGFTERPLAELAEMTRSGRSGTERALAGCQLALWHLHLGRPEGRQLALDRIEAARREGPELEVLRRLLRIELVCNALLDRGEAGIEAFRPGGSADELTADAMLARANLESSAEGRVIWINAALELSGLSPLGLLPSPEGNISPYDRLTGTPLLGKADTEGPKVTVLVAAYQAASTIKTALRSLAEQTWRNLEVLVIDDASPSPETARDVERVAATDPRFRLIRMPENAGAYAARNRGLEQASGDYVTLHDADDWSHPVKIERQVRFLEANRRAIGCLSEQARVSEDLAFIQLRSRAEFISTNYSSLLFRREPVRQALGCWDSVRFGADSEFIARMKKVFGTAKVVRMATGPLSFQRQAAGTITADAVTGIDPGYHYYGARKEYLDAQRHHHSRAASLKYKGNPVRRPFPVPPMMLPRPSEAVSFDVVYLGDFRRLVPEVAQLIADITKDVPVGERVGLVEAPVYDVDLPVEAPMCPPLRELVDGERVRVLVFGERIKTRRLVRVSVGGDPGTLRRLPQIELLE